MQILVSQVRGLLKGQDISRLRKDQDLRELVQERMLSAKVILDSLVEDARPGRLHCAIKARFLVQVISAFGDPDVSASSRRHRGQLQ